MIHKGEEWYRSEEIHDSRTQSSPLQLSMMADTIRERLAQHPFEPFVIRSSGGQGYRVASPDLIVLMKSKVFIAEAGSDRAATVSYLHIAAIEELGNGHRKARSGRKGTR
jgi:hypothetical protein